MSLRVEHVSHLYKSPMGDLRTILQPQTWSLKAGQQALLRGVSGSGKTTLFNILAGLLRPSAGDVFWDETEIYAVPEAARDRLRAQKVGYVFQNHHLIASLSALDNVIMPMAFARRATASQQRKEAQSLLDSVGLGAYAAYRPRQLSTGQRLRVAVARALINRPSLVLADEPTASLDEASAQSVMDILQQTCQSRQSILIVASHDPSLVERFSHSADLRAGTIRWVTV